MGRYLYDLHSDAYATYANTKDFVSLCFELKYAANDSTSTLGDFDSIFRGNVEEVVTEQK